MLSYQAEFCRVVLKTSGGPRTLKTARIVTLLAFAADFNRLECAVVLVLVTILAGAEGQSLE